MITKELIIRLIKIKAYITITPLEHYGLKIMIRNDDYMNVAVISFLELDDYKDERIALVINEMIKSIEEKEK